MKSACVQCGATDAKTLAFRFERDRRLVRVTAAEPVRLRRRSVIGIPLKLLSFSVPRCSSPMCGLSGVACPTVSPTDIAASVFFVRREARRMAAPCFAHLLTMTAWLEVRVLPTPPIKSAVYLHFFLYAYVRTTSPQVSLSSLSVFRSVMLAVVSP